MSSVLFTNIIKSIWDRNHASLGPENKFKVHANSKARFLFTGVFSQKKKKALESKNDKTMSEVILG